MDDKSGEEIYFEKRLWPKLQEYSIHDDLDTGRNEWTPLFDKDIPPILFTANDFENSIPILEERYNLVQNNDVGKCFCGQNIQHHCLILNKNTNHVCWIGNECIYRFQSEHLNEKVATRNKQIIKYINSIGDVIKVNEKINLLKTETSETSYEAYQMYQDVMNQQGQPKTNQLKVDDADLKELYKICRFPTEKQISNLKDFPAYHDVVENIDKLKTAFNKRLVTKRNGKNYIRVDTVKELNELIQVNLKLYSRYKSYINNIDIHTLIHNQDNYELKDDYLNGIQPFDDKKTYCKDYKTLSWRLVGESRSCKCCNEDFYVSIPSQEQFEFCKTCFIKDYLGKNVCGNINVKIKLKDTEPISKRYIFTNTKDHNWKNKEPLHVPVRCNENGCKYYGQIRCNIEDLSELDTFSCWKCSFQKFIQKQGYHTLIDITKQTLKPTDKILQKDLSYTFSHEITLCYKCIQCKQLEKKTLDMAKYYNNGWKVSFYKHCISCYKRKKE